MPFAAAFRFVSWAGLHNRKDRHAERNAATPPARARDRRHGLIGLFVVHYVAFFLCMYYFFGTNEITRYRGPWLIALIGGALSGVLAFMLPLFWYSTIGKDPKTNDVA